MSIETENPKTTLEKVDAASNLVQQMFLAQSIGDTAKFKEAHKQVSSLLFDATQEIEELQEAPKIESEGVRLIAAERDRQINVLGFDVKHDEFYDSHELLSAAGCYARSSQACAYDKRNVTFDGGYRPGEGVPSEWPSNWDHNYWRPTGDPIRDLVKAGAMIAAQIDRLKHKKTL